MKPLLNLDEPVQRRTGEPAVIIYSSAEGSYPVIALWRHSANREQVPESYTLRGSFASDGEDSEYDLINVPKPPKVFTGNLVLAIDKHGRRQTLACMPLNPHSSFVAIQEIPYSITEGEGL